MKTRLPLALACLALLCATTHAQTVNASQSVALQGVLANSGHGGFPAAAYEPDGSLVLLEDAGDGLRLLKTDAAASTTLAQAHLGASGDSGIAMALDATGNIYVTGTSTSGSLSGTSGTPYPSRADTSTNGFLAKFDTNLNLVFLTYLGAGRTAPTALAVSADAVFVTGITYSTAFPVSASAIAQTPATGSSGNGFVERFNTAGSTVQYATYLTGYGGDTSPAGIAADSKDDAFIVGQTTASGYPTLSALEPEIIGTTSGFLSELTPAGDGFTFSTFIAGNGLTSIALDPAGALALTGNISFGGFPILTVSTPLAATTYQSLVRMPANGGSITSSVLLVPGLASHLASAADGSVWISGGGIPLPLFPAPNDPLSPLGDGWLVHVTAAGVVDQTVRLGGVPVSHAPYASLTDTPAPPAIAGGGATIAQASTLTSTVTATFIAAQRFDLPLVNAPNNVLTATARDLVLACSSGQCSGKGGLLTLLNISAGASLALSADDEPNVTLRDIGSNSASGIVVTSSGFTQADNCSSTLASGSSCSIALIGTSSGSVSVSSANAGTASAALAATSITPSPIALSADELDFGVVTASGPVSRTLTITNLTSAAQTFASAADGVSSRYSVTQSSTDCPTIASGTLQVAAGGACHVTLSVAASSTSTNDGLVQAAWLIGTRDIAITGITQAASLTLSANELDFGVEFSGEPSLNLPRILYVSNESPMPIGHAPVTLPSSSPFKLIDNCPETLLPQSVCSLTVTYANTSAPSKDTAPLTLDEGLTVLLTGETLPQAAATGAAANPNLSATPASITFTAPVAVTGISSAPQTVTITNIGASPMSLNVAATGDFTTQSNCPSILGSNASCTVLVTFAPSQPGTRQGLLSITGGSSFSPTYVGLSGTATAILPVNNGILDLGQTYVGEPLIAWYKVQQSFPLLSASVTGSGFGVAVVEDNGNGHGTLSPSSFTASATSTCSNCWIGIAYTSSTAGSASGTLSITTSTAGNPYKLQLTASALAVAGVLLDPVTTDFGTVSVHSTSPSMTVALTNLLSPASALNITSITASGDFAVTTNNTGGPSCSGAVASTASCFVNVRFAPTATGQRSGSLTLATDHGTFIASLTGYGAPDPGVSLEPSSLVFNNSTDSTATSQTLTITNTGNSALTLGVVSSSSGAFTVSQPAATLAAGSSTTVQVQFTPGNAFATATLSIPITQTIDGTSQTTLYTVPLSSTYASSAAGLILLPQAADFGATTVGALGLTREFTLANTTTHTLATTITLPREFPLAVVSTACASLAPGATCVLSVSFLPAVAGQATGTVTATGTATDGSIALDALAYMNGYGTGAGALSLSASGLIPNTPLSFGQLTSGQTKSTVVTVSNSGTTAATVRRITIAPPFFATSTCGNALAPAGTCTVNVTYAPVDETTTASTSLRTDLGTLNIESDTALSPLALNLSGAVTPVLSATASTGAVLNTFALSTSALTFSNTSIGNQSPAQTVTLTNTGNTTLHISGVFATTDFSVTSTCAILSAGSSCTVTATFAPSNSSTATARPGAIEILSDASDPLEFISLIGTSSPSPLQLSATTLAFGNVTVGTSTQLGLSITNTTAAPVTFLSASATGDYTVSIGTCPAPGATLAAGTTCTLQITFTPSVAGTRTGTLSISTDATQLPLSVALTGTGTVGKLTVSPSALFFGPISTGSQSDLTLTLTNNGTATVTGIAPTITGANASNFAVSVPCSVTQLAPNQGCAITVTFTPTTTSAASATLSIASSDPSSPLLVSLTGSGTLSSGFTLTVDGGSNSSRTVSSGSPATYALTLTPTGSFTGTVAFTCAPVTPAQYGSCSLSPSTLTITNSTSQSSIATLNTVTSLAARGGISAAMLCLLLPLRRRKRWLTIASIAVGLVWFTTLGGCGGSSSSASSGNSNLRYTPAGTYQYTVTASSTSGPAVSSTVTLNLTVQ